MSAYVMAITSGGGLPVFSRKKGNSESVMPQTLKENSEPLSPALNKLFSATPTATDVSADENEEALGDGRVEILQDTDETKLGKYLLQAAAEGDLDEVTTLINRGCPFTSDWLGITALHLAAQNNQYDVCVVLLKNGITRNARNKVDRTPLHLAVYEGHLRIVKLLLDYNVEIDCRDMLDMTPLHWAVQKQHCDIVELLLRFNATINVQNKFGLSPCDIARQLKNPDISELLEGYIEDPQIATDSLVAELQQNNENLLNNVIIVDDADFINLQNSLDSGQNRSGASCLINANAEGIQPKDPIIINLTEDINEDLPPIGEKDVEDSENFSAIQLLRQHGITIINNDNEESNILNAVMENGHTVELTDVGKEVLNAVKQQEEKTVITEPTNVSQKPLKKIIMKKNRLKPYDLQTAISAPAAAASPLDTVLKELAEAKKVIGEYKAKLELKDLELEKYKKRVQCYTD